MTIIISGSGKDEILESKGVAEETFIQKYVYDHPEIIPLYEIKADKKLLILIREFRRIDALGIDKDGDIYIIETKLYKNPDKRKLVAQMLDYGTVLWKHVNFDDLITKIGNEVNKKYNMDLNGRLAEYFGINDDEEIIRLRENMERNHQDGNFKFVVLMDKIYPELLDMILYVNKNSNFDIFPVDMKYYKSKDYNIEIVIPKLYGAEIKKTSGGKDYGRGEWDETKYFGTATELIKDQEQFENLKKLFMHSKEMGGEIEWGSGTKSGTFKVRFNELPIQHQLYSVGTDGILIFGGFGMAEDGPEERQCMDKFREKLLQIGLQVPENYVDKTPRFRIGDWSPLIDKFINVVRELLNSYA